MRLLLALLLGLGCSPFALGQMYKWKDEKGVTHYGERAPAGKDASPVELKSPTGPASAAEQPSPRPSRRGETDLQRQEREFNERHRERTRTAEREHEQRMDETKRVEKERQKACRDARSELAYVKRTPEGQRGYRFNEIRALEDTISRTCR